MNRAALVTGAGRGIGFAIAGKLAELGMAVAINDLLEDRAAEAAAKLTNEGRRVTVVSGDVSDLLSVRKIVGRAYERLGPITVLVNNAGICVRRMLEDISPEEWDKTLGVNLRGTFLCCQTVAPMMKAAGWGRIVNVASISGKMGGLMVGLDYTASKGGILALTKGLARELAPQGVTVNAVCPAMVDTEMGSLFTPEEKDRYLASVPLKRLAAAEDVAEAVAYLVSDGAAYVTGEVLDVNGGLLMD